MHKYKAKMVRGGGWQSNEIARYGISVGASDRFEGAKLEAALQWLCARFKKVEISLGDVLHRHNIEASGVERDEAMYRATQIGDAWLETNGTILDRYPVSVVRWKHWLSHEYFSALLQQTQNLYLEDIDFQTSINAIAQSVALKTAGKNNIPYLIEETAVFALQNKVSPAVEVYPGSFLSAWNKFKVANDSSLIELVRHRHFTQIDFVRRQA